MIVTTIGCMVGAMKTIGSRIAAARERKGLNQSQLSTLVGVRPQSVQAWEADRNTPRPKRLGVIAAALDVTVSALVDGIGDQAALPSLTNLAGQGTAARRAAYLQDGELLIQRYKLPDMVKEEMPSGYVDLVSDITICIRQLDGLGLKYSAPANLSIITAWDQSMESTIHDKDLVLIDRGVDQYAGDGIYLIAWAGHLFIRRLQLAGTDKLELIADSPTHKDRVAQAGKVGVHAKALLVWKAGKL
jgi:transcriptional regulator with XRE-family HTH domain